jgi:hypothetical protein
LAIAETRDIAELNIPIKIGSIEDAGNWFVMRGRCSNCFSCSPASAEEELMIDDAKLTLSFYAYANSRSTQFRNDLFALGIL